MKLILENREFEFKANGRFMKTYQEKFGENIIMALYKMSAERDPLAAAQIVYCGITTDLTFDQWLDTFESPIFILDVVDTVMEYITNASAPTVESKGEESGVKKKTI